MLINFSKLRRSFKGALAGLVTTFKEEQNFRIQLVFAVAALAAAMILKIPVWQLVILLLAFCLLLILEIVNSVIERIIDMFKPRVHYYAAVIKDLMAGAVLIAGMAALVATILTLYQPCRQI